jgi:protease-4
MRAAIANVLICVFLLIVALAIFSGSDDVNVAQGSALVIAPQGAISEQPPARAPLSQLFDGSDSRATRVGDILEAIELAATDTRISLLALDLRGLTQASPALLEVVGAKLKKFRETGKTVIAASDSYSQQQYYLASFADEVYMHPMGQVLITGFEAYQDYYQQLLAHLKININVFRVGTYKTAIEPYTRSDMSAAAKKANQALVNELWRDYVNQIASNRGIDPTVFESYVNDFDKVLNSVGGDTALAAFNHGLVDKLLTNDALEKLLIERVGRSDSGSFSGTGFRTYLNIGSAQKLTLSDEKIAVIVAEGMIMMGDQPRGDVGAASTVKMIRQAREDKDVKAIVLRVDSPGGSVLASEMIRQELEIVQALGKPVIASMGGVAASGGYWISATADEIWASPNTITGSIGVFALVPTFEDSLSSIGIERDGVGTTALSGGLDPFMGINQKVKNILQSTVEHNYGRFVNLVAHGRDMEREAVEAVAQGRVWSGRKAHDLGLVDHLGHLDQAIQAAATRAGLNEYEIVNIEKPLTPQEQFLEKITDFFGLSKSPSSRLNKIIEPLRQFEKFNDPAHIYAICEICRL